MRYELTTVYDRCKSFYKKAYVEDTGYEKRLYSYDTLVATIHRAESAQWYVLHELAAYSMTTRRHVCEFLLQNGFRALSKKEMEEKIEKGMKTLKIHL
jgi:hypothetical protein